MINILLLTKRKMACTCRSTIFKKWDLQVLFTKYIHTYVTACIYTYMRHVSSALTSRVKSATSVYIACKQLIHHQPVVHTLARSEDFPVRVVRVLFHTQVLFKFKSSCSVCLIGTVEAFINALSYFACNKTHMFEEALELLVNKLYYYAFSYRYNKYANTCQLTIAFKCSFT